MRANTTTNASTSSPAVSTVWPGETVKVRLSAWGRQDSHVQASSGGGRGGAPYIAVRVGSLLVYAYHHAAAESFLTGWEKAAQINRTVRLPEFQPRSAARIHAGEDLAVVCTVGARQRHTVTAQHGPDGRPVLTVTVGAVTIDVHTTTALASHLQAWREAATVTALLETGRPGA